MLPKRLAGVCVCVSVCVCVRVPVLKATRLLSQQSCLMSDHSLTPDRHYLPSHPFLITLCHQMFTSHTHTPGHLPQQAVREAEEGARQGR